MSNAHDNSDTGNRSNWRGRVFKIGLPALIIVGGLLAGVAIMASKPTAKPAKPQKTQARLVTITPAEVAPPTLMLKANGTVQAAQSTTLKAQVSGQIISLNDGLAPGTRFDKGDVLAHIDDADYQLALTKAKTQLANAQAALQTENGQQAVAKRELALVGADVSAKERRLALRGPQLATAKANVRSAQSDVEQARLDLRRTDVRAPFSGIVTARSASIGDVISSADTIATLAATDDYWVNASVPVDQLRWLHAQNNTASGSPARVYYPEAWGKNAYVDGSVLRIQAALETSGRMARVLVKVPDPLGADAPNDHRLLLGAYVEAHITARIPKGSIAIDSAYLHANDQVWVMSANDTLDIRTVDVIYHDANQAVIASGLEVGANVVTSELNAPIQGMPLRVAADEKTGGSGDARTDAPEPTDSDRARVSSTGLRLRLAQPPRGISEKAAMARSADKSEPRS